MTFPDMITTTINLPKTLLEEIDTYAEKHLLNRSACMRLLVSKTLNEAKGNVESTETTIFPPMPYC